MQCIFILLHVVLCLEHSERNGYKDESVSGFGQSIGVK